jgi:hypothetical protein
MPHIHLSELPDTMILPRREPESENTIEPLGEARIRLEVRAPYDWSGWILSGVNRMEKEVRGESGGVDGRNVLN